MKLSEHLDILKDDPRIIGALSEMYTVGTRKSPYTKEFLGFIDETLPLFVKLHDAVKERE